MAKLDVRGLSDDQIKFPHQLIEFMRQHHQRPVSPPLDETKTIQLHSLHLGVKEEISREEIYDYIDA